MTSPGASSPDKAREKIARGRANIKRDNAKARRHATVRGKKRHAGRRYKGNKKTKKQERGDALPNLKVWAGLLGYNKVFSEASKLKD